MSNIFRSRESMAQDSALNEYASTFRTALAKKEEEQEAINGYNEKLTGITGTVGSILGIKPAEKVVRAGLQKALGFGADQIEKKITSKLGDLVNGDSEFMTKLPTNVQRGLQAVLGDNPSPEVQSAFKNLSQSAQNTINKARDRLGKPNIRDTEAPTTTDTATPTPAADAADQPLAAPTGEGDLPAAAANNLDAAQQAEDFSTRLANLSPEGRAAVRQAYTQHPDYTPQRDNPTPEQQETNANIANDELSKQEALERPAPQTEAPNVHAQNDAQTGGAADDVGGTGPAGPDAPANMGREGTALRPSPDANPAGPDAPTAGETGDSDGAAQANLDNTDLPSAAPDAATDGAAAAGDSDAISGLGDAADALDALAAGEGGLNIFADIFAGIASLATIIGGEAGRAKPAQMTQQPITSGIQFGV
tara:strand:+ start:4703 stop:5965 length:1263 start_codon:yes stop_codon:yes gene_type:complete